MNAWNDLVKPINQEIGICDCDLLVQVVSNGGSLGLNLLTKNATRLHKLPQINNSSQLSKKYLPSHMINLIEKTKFYSEVYLSRLNH